MGIPTYETHSSLSLFIPRFSYLNMSDEEMDREWKPSNRPQSTMAKSFSLALNDLFKIDNSIADLDAAVSEKKKAVSTQTSELEALCPQSSGTRMAEDMRQEIYPRLQDPAKMEMSRNRSDIDCCIIFRSTVTFWALHTLVG